MGIEWRHAGVAGAGVLLVLATAGHAQMLGGPGRADANGDGVVTRAEWQAAEAARFDRLDADRDGRLEADELPGPGRRRGRGAGRLGLGPGYRDYVRPAFDGRLHSGYDDGTGTLPTLGSPTEPR